MDGDWEEIGMDNEAERFLLGFQLLYPQWNPPAWLTADSFRLGTDGLHGWLFTRIRIARRMNKEVLPFLLNERSRGGAWFLGVRNLAYEIAALIHSRRGEARYRYTQETVRKALWRVSQAHRARQSRATLEQRSHQLSQSWKGYRNFQMKSTTL